MKTLEVFGVSESMKFIGRPYVIGYGELQIGDDVLVHPSATSIAREPYKGKVELVDNASIPKGHGDLYENKVKVAEYVAIRHPWGSFVLNEYGFNRLERQTLTLLK